MVTVTTTLHFRKSWEDFAAVSAAKVEQINLDQAGT